MSLHHLVLMRPPSRVKMNSIQKSRKLSQRHGKPLHFYPKLINGTMERNTMKVVNRNVVSAKIFRCEIHLYNFINIT